MNDIRMDPRRLELLLELCRLGSMREVAESMHVTTSTVSQQIAALARETGTPLIEPDGRRVRLTPAGQRLAGHAVTILAALEAARLDLDPAAAPAGTVRVAAFATAVRESVLPVVRLLAERHPAVSLGIHEHEPDEALGLLADDAVDLALTYDYNLAPARFDRSLATQPLGHRRWSLGTPADRDRTTAGRDRAGGTALEVFRRFADRDWIVNSRNSGDEEVVCTVASLAGFRARIVHRVDSLELVQDMILAGLGVGLLPAGRPVRRGVALRPLDQPDVTQRPFAVTRRGRSDWPPLALVLRLLQEVSEAGTTPVTSATEGARTGGAAVVLDVGDFRASGPGRFGSQLGRPGGAVPQFPGQHRAAGIALGERGDCQAHRHRRTRWPRHERTRVADLSQLSYAHGGGFHRTRCGRSGWRQTHNQPGHQRRCTPPDSYPHDGLPRIGAVSRAELSRPRPDLRPHGGRGRASHHGQPRSRT
jgi:DNA-binding transcriptional LysR family regulator